MPGIPKFPGREMPSPLEKPSDDGLLDLYGLLLGPFGMPGLVQRLDLYGLLFWGRGSQEIRTPIKRFFFSLKKTGMGLAKRALLTDGLVTCRKS
jgi:hypothetical protein